MSSVSGAVFVAVFSNLCSMREIPAIARRHNNGCWLARKISIASAFSWASALGIIPRSARMSSGVIGPAAAASARLQPIKLNMRYANVVNTVWSLWNGGRVAINAELSDQRVRHRKPLDAMRVGQLSIDDEASRQKT